MTKESPMPSTVPVSVVMPVHNGERFLDEAVRSILGQTFRDFEFIIVNDGSTDRTATILECYQAADSRVRVIHQDKRGIYPSSNTACQLARGKYLARMEADDISLPQRLETQVRFLEGHPEISVCGTAHQNFGEGMVDTDSYPPVHDASIRCSLLFYCSILHPTVMFRREIVAEKRVRYDPEFVCGGDYKFWTELSAGHQFRNIPAVLLRYRRHPQQNTTTRPALSQTFQRRVRREQLERLGLTVTEEEARIHDALGGWRFESNRNFVFQAGQWLEKVRRANLRTGIYPQRELERLLSNYWYRVCRATSGQGFWTLKQYWTGPRTRRNPVPLLKMAVHCGSDRWRS